MQPHIAVSENRDPTSAELDEKAQISGTVAGVDDPNSPSLEDASVARKSARTTTFFAVAGCTAANFSDGYQQQIASNVNVILKHMYGSAYTAADQTRISDSLIVGQILGIILLGFITDGWSRKAGMVFTSSLVVVGSLMATLALKVQHLGVDNMLWYLTIARGIAGVGVGGEFPAGATAACEGMEDYNPAKRGPIFVCATTFITCWGGPVCIFVYLMTLIGSNNDLTTAYISVNTISILLPFLVFLFRLRMEDSKLFRRSNFKSTKTVSIPLRLILKRYWLRLAGTGGAFFIYDFVNFPNSIMSSTIINSLVPGKALQTVALWQLILALMTLPGVFVGIFLVNRLGRRWTGILGFGGYLLIGLIVGCSFAEISKVIPAFVVMYGLMQSLGHMGPGATLGLVSTESYPTAIRGVCYAISAALGKAGAAVGTEVFTPIKENLGQRWTFFFAAIFGAIGMVVYWFLIEDMTEADLLAEDKAFELYLRENGWDGKMLEKAQETE
ncbi:mfs git1p-like glycerophosphoinositol permease [Diplodia corticola]|uniref:Mfs git1p-like glycerophosphoinositol permease n=1 Tax=Diplodia corticola TaxID=236234 RepID=A0A1J9RKH5_9PEZI|nr:mfs git1p-like glycerophosphoinositol permease [Diplodia corticola]OJD40466.1 mfs git1p-like glycerophosphoinositol permease [Diplodia corticola]